MPPWLSGVEGVDAQLVVRRLQQLDARHITVHHAPQGRRDGPQDVPEIQVRNDIVGYLQQQLQPVTFVRELLLQGLSLLGVQGVVDGDRHLGRHQLGEGDLRRAIGATLRAADRQGAQAAMGGAQGQGAEGADAVRTHRRRARGKRVSWSRSPMTSGCCCCQTQPDGMSSTA